MKLKPEAVGVIVPARRVPVALQVKVKEELVRMEEQGVIAKREVHDLGHVLSAEGLLVDAQRNQDILEMPPPKNPSVLVGTTRAVGLRARALHPAAQPERRRRLLVPPSRLLYFSETELARSGRPVNQLRPRPLKGRGHARRRKGDARRVPGSDGRRRSTTGAGLEDGPSVPAPSHQDFTRPGPPANLFLCVTRLPECAASSSRPVGFCTRGQDKSSRASGPSSTPSCPARTPPPSARATKPPALPLRARAGQLRSPGQPTKTTTFGETGATPFTCLSQRRSFETLMYPCRRGKPGLVHHLAPY
nr:uncharacterized protein LOC129384612 [Dermacentor andersoni]